LTGIGIVVAFWLFAVLAIASALAIIAARNLVHAVLALVLSFIGVAGLFITLSADFLAVAQVLVYAGAIGVLTIFAIMLTPRSGRHNSNAPLFWPATVLAVIVFGVIAIATLVTAWPVQGRPGFDSTAAAIGAAVLGHFALPFEVVSVVLLAALIGAIVLVRTEPFAPATHQEDATET
jgi:NADH-quinone oxidoreductase subunit J